MNNDITFCSTEREAAAALGIGQYTAKRWRLDGKIPAHCYTKIGYKTVRYCLPLLRDWQLDPTDLQAQSRAIAVVQDSRISNAPKKRGRKIAV
jgi:hypothetical protein